MLSRTACATVLRVPSYLLRVQLEDRPGSLGSLAVALGSVGADILSLDVVERGTGYAVDDLVVELPQGAMPDMLITAAEQINGVYVDAIRPHTGLLEAHRELELIDHIAAAPAKKKLQVLADEAPRVLRVGWCTVVRLTESGPRAHRRKPRRSRDTGRRDSLAATRSRAKRWTAGPSGCRRFGATWTPRWPPPHSATPSTAVVLGRPGGPLFRPSEVARLGYLAGIVATILR